MERPAARPTLPRRLLAHLRRTFIAGLLVTIPVVLTYWVLSFLFHLIDGVLNRPLEQALGRRIPGLGSVVLVVLIYVLGLIGANFLGRRAIHLSQQALLRIPVISTVYSAVKALVESLFGSSGAASVPRRVVLIEYPGPGLWTIGFLTGMTRNEEGEAWAIVYVPTAPTPQTGWVAMVPIAQVYETDLTVQAAMRLVLSGGVLSPERMNRKPIAT